MARTLIVRGLMVLLTWLAALVAGPIVALADLRLCNATPARIGVAIGYRDRVGWATEGWWNVPPQTCETLLRGAVPSRYLYVYAVDYDRGGEWSGPNIMCTAQRTFASRATTNCEADGLKPTGFIEIDTGQTKEWTIRLTDPAEGEARGQ